jgi:pSer/pThr/pTyr-binding forkhead associated (FHA) protein
MVCLSLTGYPPSTLAEVRGIMTVLLTILSGPTRTSTVRLKKREMLVGRQRGCDIRIPSDEISRRHCLLYFDRGQLTLEDLRSANGTFLNGQRIQERQTVKHGDQIQIGPLVFRVDLPADTEITPKHVDESAADREPIYYFADEKKRIVKNDIEIELDPNAFQDLPQGEDFRDLLRGMDH